MRIVAGLLLLLSLAACQGPSPYWVMTPNRGEAADLLYLRDPGGVVVLPVDGLDSARGAALTAALVDALQRANVPAGTGDGAGNSASHFLSAVARTGPPAEGSVPFEIVWDLLDREGAVTGSGRETLSIAEAIWNRPAPEGFGPAGDRLAVPIAALVQSDGEADTQDALVPSMPIAVAGLSGAPGDGGETVPRLMTHLLERQGFSIAGEGQAALGVTGTYRATPADNGAELVAIRWRLTAPDGREIGIIDQENRVPRGSLNGDWGEAAYYVALGAVDGILGLLAGGG